MKIIKLSFAAFFLSLQEVSSFMFSNGRALHNPALTKMHASIRYRSSPLGRAMNDFLYSPFDLDIKPESLSDENDVQVCKFSPRHELTEDGDKLKVMIDIPGVKAEDMDVELKEGGRLLYISGKRVINKKNFESESMFEKTFGLGKRFDVDKITADLSHGVLTITVPHKVLDEKWHDKKIEIIQH